MPKWIQTLNLSDQWKLCETKQITPNDLATSISNKLWRSLTPYDDEHVEGTRQELIESFRFASKTSRLTSDDLDNLMEDLYDWGDIDIGQNAKVCWIKTF